MESETLEIIRCAAMPDVWQAAQRLAHLPGLLVFDSAERSGDRGRFSFVLADPVATIRLGANDPIPLFLEEFPVTPLQHSIDYPFIGGWAGLFGYELARRFDCFPVPGEAETPDLVLGAYDLVLAHDHLEQTVSLVSSGWIPDQGFNRQRARKRLEERLKALNSPEAPQVPASFRTSEIRSDFTKPEYLEAVERVLDYLRAGDCFQINLSQRLEADFSGDPLALYDRLRRRNPAPFACYYDLGDAVIASASPERFLQLNECQTIVTRPIKGTRPRGRTPAEDQALAEELRNSAKDRAENAMIVDLLRNDLGRVCEFGSVTTSEVFQIESYRRVHHLVSEVRGKLRSGLKPFDVLRAACPGGSITGAPKIRACEIIAELEQKPRGVYCGSIGYLGLDGRMDTNLLIRTFTIACGKISFPVGGGITIDSNPKAEYEETLHKAAGLLDALREEPG